MGHGDLVFPLVIPLRRAWEKEGADVLADFLWVLDMR